MTQVILDFIKKFSEEKKSNSAEKAILMVPSTSINFSSSGLKMLYTTNKLNLSAETIIKAKTTILPRFDAHTGRLSIPEISRSLSTPNIARTARTIPTRPSPAIMPEQKRIPSLTIAAFSSYFLLSLSRAKRTIPPTIMQALR